MYKKRGAEIAFSRSRASQKQRYDDSLEYMGRYFSEYGRLPSREMVVQDGAQRNCHWATSEASRQRHINKCLKLWQEQRLSIIPLEVVIACNNLFAEGESIPNVLSVLKICNTSSALDEHMVAKYIESWSLTNFAVELFVYQASSDRTNLRWLAFHPQLSQWRTSTLDYLKILKSDHVRKTSRLALVQFFSTFLMIERLPLNPQEFLSCEFHAPCFYETCLSKFSSQEINKRWCAVYKYIDYILESCEGFTDVDTNGYRIRLGKYHNPLPMLLFREDSPPQQRLQANSLQDPELRFITIFNPELEQWRAYGVEWCNIAKSRYADPQAAVKRFVVDYIGGARLPTNPATLLSREWQRQSSIPRFIDVALAKVSAKHQRAPYARACEFIDYVLDQYYSDEDDYGRRLVSGDFHNFLLDQSETLLPLRPNPLHSNKDVLPSRYIRYLRELVCPPGAQNFSDLEWSKNVLQKADWFKVPLEMIDVNDPDCVWRTREIEVNHERPQKLPTLVYEIWSPVRTIALLLKLELPLRTFQVRLSDSGEADTWRYQGSSVTLSANGECIYRAGSFIKNEGPLVSSLGNVERHSGIFRKIFDVISGIVFTGLYINTNKTQDRNKDEWDRGYVIEWQHAKVLYWCEKLRNWQEKYNPVDALVPCTELPTRVIGARSDLQKQQMGSMSFLFRDPTSSLSEAGWPITDNKIDTLWDHALEELERICAVKGHKSIDGKPIRFVKEDKLRDGVDALYPLHSLRVSLITHLATAGGVDMHILSQCIAGHSRILMTLYYTKAGVVYVSEAMERASERLKDELTEQQNWLRWLKEASLKQLEINSAAVDASVFSAVQSGFEQGGLGLLRTNLGLCAKGGMGCDNGGILTNEETGKVSYGPVPGYPQQKNCVRCRWFLTGPAFLQALVHHWNLLHFNLGETGERYLHISEEVVDLESKMLDCQRLNVVFERDAELERLRHSLSAIYEGNEKLAGDSLATIKLIARCKHIIDSAKNHDSGIALVAVGGMEEVAINMKECKELEQILTVASGSTIYVDEDAHRAVLKAGNAFDRMLTMNGKAPVFFKLSDKELPRVVAQMTNMLRAHTGSIEAAVPFVEGISRLTDLGLLGDSDEILNLASAGATFSPSGHNLLPPPLPRKKKTSF